MRNASKRRTCISLSSPKVGLYDCTANDYANATFLFRLDSLLVYLLQVAIWLPFASASNFRCGKLPFTN